MKQTQKTSVSLSDWLSVTAGGATKAYEAAAAFNQFPVAVRVLPNDFT
jgi:hypothetical protein